MSNNSLCQKSEAFLNYLEYWMEQLPISNLDSIVESPEKCAILSVDLTNGFCNEGALASPRVAKIVTPIVKLFTSAWNHDIHQILLINDTHEPDALEFSAFPPHCVRGTEEAEPVNEIKALPFFDQMYVFPKNSVSVGSNTGLDQWLSQHPSIDTFIVVGDCTDICTYQLALHLLTEANSLQINRRIIVPVDCVDTYDRTVETSKSEGGMAHPADLFHAVFLYHMALNGIEIVQHIE